MKANKVTGSVMALLILAGFAGVFGSFFWSCIQLGLWLGQ